MKKSIFLSLALALVQCNAYAQGCSDAGFCTMGSMKHSEAADASSTQHQQLSAVLTNGLGEQGVYVFTPAIQYDNMLNKNWSVQAKITANSASGNLGSAAGLGDVYLAGLYTFGTDSKWQKIITAGGKIPLNNGNLQADGKSLPMPYQSSLGTYDVVLGFTMTNAKWNFSAAYQQPLTATNQNEFLSVAGNTDYLPTRSFRRNGDALLRASYQFTPLKNLSLTPGILAIYHLGNDAYTNSLAAITTIQNSAGLTVNLTALAKYKLNDRIDLGLSAGLPVLVREARPDGLTRSLVVAPELSIRF